MKREATREVLMCLYGEFLKRQGYKAAFLIRSIAVNGRRYTQQATLCRGMFRAEICPFSKFFFFFFFFLS